MADTGKPQQHTQGPWRVAPRAQRGTYASVVADMPSGTFLTIAHVDSVDGFSGSSDANAALIAAAPELLAALVAVLPFAECEEEQRVYLMSAGDDEWAETMVRPVAQALAAARAALRLATLPAEGGAP
jgi:hypothetical protein